jgi:hypothetical protein
MPVATIRLDYSDTSYEIFRYEFDTLKDAVIYSRLIRMRNQQYKEQLMNKKIHKSSRIYKQLVTEGIVESGKTVYHKDIEQLQEKMMKGKK